MASTCCGFHWYGAGPPMYISVISRPWPWAITSGEVGGGRRGLRGRGVGLGACTMFGLFTGVMLRGNSGIWNDKQNQKHTALSDHSLGPPPPHNMDGVRDRRPQFSPFNGVPSFHRHDHCRYQIVFAVRLPKASPHHQLHEMERPQM